MIEGVDGAGTTTQSARLVATLGQQGIVAHAVREPSDRAIGRLLREIITGSRRAGAYSESQRAAQLALMFAADRLDHQGAEVMPRLSAGTWVVSDRYDHSSVAYQSLTGGGAVSAVWLRELNRHALRPDLTIVLDVPAEVARARRLSRGATRELFDDDDLQRGLVAFYAEVERLFPDDRIVHVDAARDADRVFQDVLVAALELAK